MAYTALYRKWRPTKFEEVLGQDHIVRTLKNQLNSERVGHAYLFTGTRGTGKTSVAKIFARAVNCEHPVDGSPCNECPSCRAILSGNSVNVVEIDAASNNGVDNIREIREEVKYKPTEGRYRVYIIDEVHMLSAGAFNALLKTLEEPPEYVIFILATTEVHKIPITVLSRCQRYDFKRLTMAALEGQIRHLLDEEKVAAEDKAITYIARCADGSSRDGLSLLEQCISFYYGETLTYENVLEVLGAADQTVFSELLRAVLEYDTGRVIHVIDDLLSTGRDLNQFVLDLIWYFRNLLMIQTENPSEDVLGISAENLQIMRKEAGDMDIDQVMRYIRILSELSNRMRYAASKRVLLETALLKMMQPETEQDIDTLIQRINMLEDKLRNGVSTASPVHQAESKPAEKVLPPKIVEVTQAQYDDYKQVEKAWNEILSERVQLSRSLLRGTRVTASGNAIEILFTEPFRCATAEKDGRMDDVKAALRERFGKEFTIRCRCLRANESVPQVVVSNHLPGIDMEIEE